MMAALILTHKVIKERIKAILDADPNLQALSADSSPPGPPDVQTSFMLIPTKFPTMQIDLDPRQELAIDYAPNRILSTWTYYWILRIFTRHAVLEQAQDDARFLADYLFLALTNKPALQLTNTSTQGLVQYSYLRGYRSQGRAPEEYGAVPVYVLDVDFITSYQQRSR